MTATKALGTYGNAVGVVTPADHKAAQSGLIAKTALNAVRPGLFWGGNANVIVGKANMTFDVIAWTGAFSRGSTSGTTIWSNDGTLNVATTSAPGSNSRIDITYAWPREYSLDGVDSNPVIGVIQGTAAASPTAPSLAAFPGAIEIGRATVGAGITATTSATITQTAPFTCVDGGRIPFRNTTERDAGTYIEGQLGWLIDTDSLQVYSGSAWSSVGQAPVVPTVTLGGVGSRTIDAVTGEVTLNGVGTSFSVDGLVDVQGHRNFEIELSGNVTSTQTWTMRLRASGADISGSNYVNVGWYMDATGAPTSDGANGAASSSRLNNMYISGINRWLLRVFAPLIATEETQIVLNTWRKDQKTERVITYTTAAAHTGITFFIPSGTFTGRLKIVPTN